MFPNLHARPLDSNSAGGEVKHSGVKSLSDFLDTGSGPPSLKLPTFSPEQLLGLTFLRETEDGQKIRAKVTRKVMDRDAENHENIKFLISCGEEEYEELIAYNKLSDIVERQHLA